MFFLQNQELAKSNQVTVETEKLVKQLKKTERVEKSRTEEYANLARRLQGEKDLQKKEARTPLPTTIHHALCYHVFSCMWSPRLQLARAEFNDHYSPVEAADYIEQRLRPTIAYYQLRVPSNTYFGMTMKVLLLTAAVAASVLAKYEYNQLVTIATAFASMITAYSEFADAGRKVER